MLSIIKQTKKQTLATSLSSVVDYLLNIKFIIFFDLMIYFNNFPEEYMSNVKQTGSTEGLLAIIFGPTSFYSPVELKEAILFNSFSYYFHLKLFNVIK